MVDLGGHQVLQLSFASKIAAALSQSSLHAVRLTSADAS